MLDLIKDIEVEKLFGRYDYLIHLGNESDMEADRMSLLYGDNGSGKTTILNLVFHLLSSERYRGHKTYIATVPFRKLSVTFSDGTIVYASRARAELTGSFELGLNPTENEVEKVMVETDPESGAVPSREISPELEGLLDRLSSLVPDVYYLRDNRTLDSDALPDGDIRFARYRTPPHIPDDERSIMEHRSRALRETVLQESIVRTQHQLYVEFARVSTRGEADARQIYANVLRSIASAASSPATIANQKGLLEKELEELEEISERFAVFDLGSAIDIAPLSESLSNADELTLPVVVQVLKSFLDGQRARLSALEVLYRKMHNFVATTNEYFTDKTVELDISEGLTVHVPGGELRPEVLSSGEQHLLLLFLNLFTSSQRPRLFIIDEPELSLNVKWQRQLVDSLLALTENAPSQFLLATHSIELLSKHMEYVRHLKP